jgi:hypothetical protein
VPSHGCPPGMCMKSPVVYAAPTSPVSVPKLRKVISGWHESYHSNFDRSLAGCEPSDTNAPDPSGTVSCEHG